MEPLSSLDGRSSVAERVRREIAIESPYLLVMPIPCYVDEQGALYLEPSWHHDLREHLSYLKNFVLCAPGLPLGDRTDLMRFEPPEGVRFSAALVPAQTSILRALTNLPRTAKVLWKAIGGAHIVHSSVIGWPFPLGWIANPFAVARGKKLIVIVESPWLMRGADRQRWRHRLLDLDPVRELMARWSCKQADLALFTQEKYMEALRGEGTGAAYVTPAVWVNEEDILDDASADALWSRKQQEPARLLFAGRMLASKGIEILLASLRELDQRGYGLAVDMIGQGALREACIQASSTLRNVRLSVLDPVPYGQPFFDLVQRYHAVVVPSLSDEQPRIVFDAYARGVPVIASDTDGLRPHVEHGRTGWLVQPGSVEQLRDAIAHVHDAPGEVRERGLLALAFTRGFTHRSMHMRRAELIEKHRLAARELLS